jgi:hypothetical protein
MYTKSLRIEFYICKIKTIYMRKPVVLLFILASIIVFSSCTTYRGSAGGGCQMNRNLVGYK